ncbi:MAG: DUF3054 family protein, partial [Caldilineaceae bacterium]|nr:DUF3054 family protein [Caldilineaceae bacterium]
YIGQRDHGLVDAANPLWGVLWTAAPFVVVWLPVAALLGVYPLRAGASQRVVLTRALNAWLVAAPLGILLRAYILGRAVIPTSFLVATLGFGGLFLLGWRVVALMIWTTYMRWQPGRDSDSHGAPPVRSAGRV